MDSSGMVQGLSAPVRPSVSPDSDELETCCVCLDSLSSAPVSMLLEDSPNAHLGQPVVRTCSHYIHTECAEKLRPSKCPLCRASFSLLSEPVDRQRLSQLKPEDLLIGLGKLSPSAYSPSSPSSAPPYEELTVPTRSVLELLAATLPVPEDALQHDLEAAQAEAVPGQISVLGLTRALRRLGIECTSPQRHGQFSRPVIRYSWTRRVGRRLQWLALKAAGAAGAGFLWGAAGIFSGVLVGGLCAVPSHRLPEFEGNEDSIVLFLKVSWVLCLVVRHGAQRFDLVCRGLKWGACLGASMGWFHGLVVVNPDSHGICSVFWAGLTGSTLGSFGRGLRPLSGRSRRVSIFKEGSSVQE
eukprot:TRINITY_DN14137_c1_g2_i2.p1 TRINITY_DN14137_c1_g2~~TRINITY_DN14137_c1_g2_i2.p1  ORF type:complete len:382 (-),score=48.80 TRINITY_DN14137_c1_g2_i2:100-1164(-)